MGCPAGTYVGYEPATNLDFDTDQDGSTHTAGVGTAEDTYYNGDAGFEPIGRRGTSPTAFSATFEGNGHTISNLFINVTSGDGNFVGLFSDLTGTIRNVGLVAPYVKTERTNSDYARTGVLLARISNGTVSGSYVSSGNVNRSNNSGSRSNYTACLVGYIYGGTVSDSWASCAVTSRG